MRFLAVAIVLTFPILDLVATARFARLTGIPMWVWLFGGLIAGVALLRNERVVFRARTVAAMHGEASILRGMLDSGRKVLAGFLFLLPGVMSDLIGLGLLLLPINVGRGMRTEAASGSIDGDFRRIE
ncbi:MAG TPA: FxsA family protein [Casimicrobiaceae bacterium]|jgi:UPF0716 protein FxsA|nr:FxsA family protein [Casimicrobiaceae bacterium]